MLRSDEINFRKAEGKGQIWSAILEVTSDMSKIRSVRVYADCAEEYVPMC